MRLEANIAPRMPDPAVYEQEYGYWPWGQLLALAAKWVCTHAPLNGYVVDYMCGTGFLLNEIAESRPDLSLAGCDVAPAYVDYAVKLYPRVNVNCRNVFDFRPAPTPQIIICTAGLHHLQRSQQEDFIAKVSNELKPGSFFLLGEEVIADFQNDCERKAAALQMGTALLSFAIASGAPDAVLNAAVDVLGNDLLERGEYKLTNRMLLAMLQPAFVVLSQQRVWPSENETYGDILYCCKRL